MICNSWCYQRSQSLFFVSSPLSLQFYKCTLLPANLKKRRKQNLDEARLEITICLLISVLLACFSCSQRQESECRTNWSEDAAPFGKKKKRIGAGAPVHTCACGWDRFGNRRYLSRDRGRREEERETDNENQGEVMLAWGEEDRDQK